VREIGCVRERERGSERKGASEKKGKKVSEEFNHSQKVYSLIIMI
jgi:hypothetical protein